MKDIRADGPDNFVVWVANPQEVILEIQYALQLIYPELHIAQPCRLRSRAGGVERSETQHIFLLTPGRCFIFPRFRASWNCFFSSFQGSALGR